MQVRPPIVGIQLQPVLKSIVYAGLVGEFVRNTGLSNVEQIGALQQLVSEGLVAKVIVIGRHSDGRDERYTMEFGEPIPGETISLSDDPGQSYCEKIDIAFAAALQYASNQMKRLGLVPRFEVEWSPKAKADPNLVANAARKLNVRPPPALPIVPPRPNPDLIFHPMPQYIPPPPQLRYPQTIHSYKPPPPPPQNFERKIIADIRPAKDPSLRFTIETMRRNV